MYHHVVYSANRRRRLAGLRRFARDEEGAAYTLSYVMVIPFYALLMCLIIETVLMMTAKLGTVYAAFAAARTATVWSSHTTWEKAQKKAQKAAVKSMVPFASGTQSVFSTVPTDPAVVTDGLAYWGAYKAFTKEPVSKEYLAAKFGYATRNVKVTIDGPPATSDAPIKAKVTYKFPFNVPGIGRILGERGDGGYYYTLTSEATIPNEGPRDNRRTIGIGYGILE
jgi:Flp pilus assembly protein TadG